MLGLWEEGVMSARKTLLKKSEDEIAERTFFEIWEETIQKIYGLNYKDGDWELASDEEKLKAFEGKIFSFENFKKETWKKIIN